MTGIVIQSSSLHGLGGNSIYIVLSVKTTLSSRSATRFRGAQHGEREYSGDLRPVKLDGDLGGIKSGLRVRRRLGWRDRESVVSLDEDGHLRVQVGSVDELGGRCRRGD